jgi:hypothetical protein
LEIVKVLVRRKIGGIISLEALEEATRKSAPYDQKCDQLSAEIKVLLKKNGYVALDPQTEINRIVRETASEQRELARKIRQEGPNAFLNDDVHDRFEELIVPHYDRFLLVEGAIELIEAADEVGIHSVLFADQLVSLERMAINFHDPKLETRFNALAVTANLKNCVRRMNPKRMGLAN